MENCTVDVAIKLLIKEFKKEFGEDAKLDGGEICGVFNDGVITISDEGETTKIRISAGKPYFIDCSLNLTEQEG